MILPLQRLKRKVTVWRQVLHLNVVALLGWMSQMERDDIRVSLISAWCDRGNINDYLRRSPMVDRNALVRFVSVSVDSPNMA